MSKTFLHIGNSITMWLLKSPLHRLLSNRLLIVDVTGRKSGQHYQTPVEYARDSDYLYILSTDTRKWWRNVQPSASICLYLNGARIRGTASASAEPEQVQAAIRLLFPRMAEEEQTRFASGKVVIRVGELYAA